MTESNSTYHTPAEQDYMVARINDNKWVIVYEDADNTYAQTISMSGKLFSFGTRVMIAPE